MVESLALPAFGAGVLMFLAPCTLPLVPAYLGFISGLTVKDISSGYTSAGIRRRVFWNGVSYVIGFSAVFILLGTLAGLGGRSLIHYRVPLGRLGGLFIIFFGLTLLRWLPSFLQTWLDQPRRVATTRFLTPGHPASSFLFGAIFAFGWTPCVGPILASVLLLAATTTTVGSGAFLLVFFSLGLAVPFLLIAATLSWSLPFLKKLGPVLEWASRLGGVLLLALGVLLLTGQFEKTIAWAFSIFGFFGYERLLNYL